MSYIPKVKYRNKVRERLVVAQNMLNEDRLRLLVQLAEFPTERLERLLQGEKERKKSQPRKTGSPTVGQEIHNNIKHVSMLLHQDVTALLDALDKIEKIMVDVLKLTPESFAE